jgi:CheY-specific phosphatase CheX
LRGLSRAIQERFMSRSVALTVWQEAVEGGLRDLARDGMGFPQVEVLERTTNIPVNMPGAFIPLIGPNESVQIGLVSSPEGCLQLARALLQGDDATELGQADMADALGEAANILAGFVKRNMLEHVHPVQLGLPLYVNGHLETSDRVRAAVTHLSLGPVRAAVVVLRAAEWKAVQKAA